MARTKDTTPWTWEEIAGLKGSARLAFLRTYGDRAKAALVASDHPPGEYTPHVNCYGLWHPMHAQRDKFGWVCANCPLDRCHSWRRGIAGGSCSARAMEVYARMVQKLGLLPEKQR